MAKSTKLTKVSKFAANLALIKSPEQLAKFAAFGDKASNPKTKRRHARAIKAKLALLNKPKAKRAKKTATAEK